MPYCSKCAQLVDNWRHDCKPASNTAVANAVPVANVVANATNGKRYEKWREANPELYKARQREYMKAWRLKQKS
jgi:hypothetical protein